MGIHEGKHFAQAVAPRSVQRTLPGALPDILIVDVMCGLYAMQSMTFASPSEMAHLMLRDALRFQGLSRLVLVADKRRLKNLTAPKAAEAEKRLASRLASYAAKGIDPPTPYPPDVTFTDSHVTSPTEGRIRMDPARVIETVRNPASTMAWWTYLEGFVHRTSRTWGFEVECRFTDVASDTSEVPFGTYGEADLEIVHYAAFNVFEGRTVFVLTLDTDFMAHFFLYRHLLNDGVTVWWIQSLEHTVQKRDKATGEMVDDLVPPWVMHMPTFCAALAHVPPRRFAEICLLLGTDFVERGWWVKGVTAVNAGSMAVDPAVVASLERLPEGRMRPLAGALIDAFLRKPHRRFEPIAVSDAAEAAFQRGVTYWTRAIPPHVDHWAACVAALRANMA